MKRYYLAYGSNLNLLQMSQRCPKARPIGYFFLNGYRLVYKGDSDNSSYLTIEEHENSTVPLGLFEVTMLDILSLDTYEGYPTFYSKKRVPLTINNREEKALIYVMNEGYDYHLPSKSYEAICMEGYRNFGFDQGILKKAYSDTYQEMHKGKGK